MSRLCDLSDESKLWSLLILSGVQNELILSGVQNDFKWCKAIVI